MRFVPLLDVFGFDLGPPTLWPMGTGAGQPSVLERAGGGGDRVEFRWDPSGRLGVVEVSLRPGLLFERITYRWADDGTLARIEFDSSQEDGSDGPDGTPEVEVQWTWADGRPVRIESERPASSMGRMVTSWDWSPDGGVARVTESSRRGVLWVHTARFDPAGRLLCVDGDHRGDGTVDRRLEVTWSPDGRILSARRREARDMSKIYEVSFEWDERGRLVAQTSDVYGSRSRWVYHHEGDAPP